MLTQYKTPEQRKREHLDNAIALIIVHSNFEHDPDKVSKEPVQELIDSNIADYIWEFCAFHESFVRHSGEIIDNNRRPGDYYINNLAGNDYIVAGGSLGDCHLGVYAALLSSRFTRETIVHLPADAIYKAEDGYDSGESYLDSRLVDLTFQEFKRYKDLAKILFSRGYEMKHDNKTIESSGDKGLRLMLWSKKELMLQYLSAKAAQEAR